MNATRAVEWLTVIGGDRQVVSLAGLHLLGFLADRLGLTAAYSGLSHRQVSGPPSMIGAGSWYR